MNEKLLLEYVDRAGIVTLKKLAAQTGAADSSLRQPVLSLIEQKDVFFCRLDHCAETLISIHLLFCLMSVYTEPALSPDAQDILDWLSDRAPAAEGEMREQMPPVTGGGFVDAFVELQQKLCVAPAKVLGDSLDGEKAGGEFMAGCRFKWTTTEAWLKGMHRAGRYRELEYCISEIRRLMCRHFTTRELNGLIYRGTI